MPEKSGFFDSTADDLRTYPARDFAEYFARFITNGVFNGGTNLEVRATGNDANVRLSPGYAWISGYVYSVYDQPLVLGIQPAGTQDRIDRIILRLDTSTPVRAIRAIVLQGTPNANPVPPDLVRAGTIYDLSLAQVRVKANSTIIEAASVTDERLNEAVCGLVNSLIRVDTATFQRQFDAFMDSIKNQGYATADFVNQRVMTGGYGETTNAGNAYSVNLNPAPDALVSGLRVVVKINAANTGASTLNVNGLGAKGIKKANGSGLSSGNLKAGSIYTMVYDGSAAFILQGEGGEYGTATAADVLAPATIGTDAGIVQGTLPNRSAENHHMPGLELSIFAGDRIFIKPPWGAYNGASWVTAPAPWLTAENLRKGVQAGPITGELEPNAVIAGDKLVHASSRGEFGHNTQTPHFVAGLKPSFGGVYRVSFHLDKGSNYEAYAQIYVNGSPRGIFRENKGSTQVATYVEDIAVNAGDEIQLHSWRDNYSPVGHFVYTKDFTLSIGVPVTDRW